MNLRFVKSMAIFILRVPPAIYACTFNQSIENAGVAFVKGANENQSVENAGVPFVKGTNERNEFFEKIKKQ